MFVFPVPAPPTGITVIEMTTESLTINWTAPEGQVHSYYVSVFRESDPVFEYSEKMDNTSNYIMVTGLPNPGVAYDINITAESHGLNSTTATGSSRASEFSINDVHEECLFGYFV